MKRRKDAYERIIRAIDERNNYTSRIGKKINMSHAYAQKRIQSLIGEDIVIRLPRKSTRICLILSEKGERIRQLYSDLDDAYSSDIQKEKGGHIK